MRGVLIDAGPLVALIDRGDAEHATVVAALQGIREPLLTVWPAVTEAMYLLGFSWQAQAALWDMLEEDVVRLLALTASDASAIRSLMDKYRDLPMDLADAALVHVAEREGLHRVLTIDRRDFSVYRTAGGRRLEILPPSS